MTWRLCSGVRMWARNSEKGYNRQIPKVVGLNVKRNLSHVELPLCSGVPFQKCRNRSLQNVCCTKNICTVNTARLADFLYPCFGTGKKKEKYIILQMFAF
jgi:hypothetical protein